MKVILCLFFLVLSIRCQQSTNSRKAPEHFTKLVDCLLEKSTLTEVEKQKLTEVSSNFSRENAANAREIFNKHRIELNECIDLNKSQNKNSIREQTIENDFDWNAFSACLEGNLSLETEEETIKKLREILTSIKEKKFTETMIAMQNIRNSAQKIFRVCRLGKYKKKNN